MDAAEWWDSSTDLAALFDALPKATRKRKARLFGCACTRQGWDLLPDGRFRIAVEVAEKYADGGADEEEMIRARKGAMASPSASHSMLAALLAHITLAASHPSSFMWAASAVWNDALPSALVRLLRDVFVNPFRPCPFDPAWLTGPVPGLAEAAYTERLLPNGTLDPVRLAVLADALEDNGADPAILAHLRGPGPHVRGCWVVDLCTGRG
jgi:hypothetical protein